jgi:lipopolysaccharide transport system permease protein
MLLPLSVLITMLALAVGLFTSALNVKFRDVRYVIPFLVQVWMFVTPVIYPTSLVPARWRWVLNLNPIAGLVEGYRSAFFGRPFDTEGLAASALLTIALFAAGSVFFRQMERSFADLI